MLTISNAEIQMLPSSNVIEAKLCEDDPLKLCEDDPMEAALEAQKCPNSNAAL
jgi:hypothetical protein